MELFSALLHSVRVLLWARRCHGKEDCERKGDDMSLSRDDGKEDDEYDAGTAILDLGNVSSYILVGIIAT